jgi:hypothetical protein
MPADPFLPLLADLVLALHAAVIAFIVGGLALVMAGNLAGWNWVNAFWFRVAHVGAIGFVVVETWLGQDCPLTTIEMRLRAGAGEEGYAGGFIAHWLRQTIYFEAPPWAFTLAYTVFGVLVAAAWRWFPPRRR